MSIGQLRHRVRLQAEFFAKDPVTGENTSEWRDICTVWAAVEPIRGKELFQSLENHSELTTKIRIRYRAGLTTAMRVQYGSSHVLYIEAIIDPEERHRELQLICVEKNPPGPGE